MPIAQLALEIVDETARYLALGCLNFARLVDPSIIVFAGGATGGESGELLLKHTRKHTAAYTWSVLPTPAILATAQVSLTRSTPSQL